jgi:EmrB/QacA subfamily drug resistance transporter
MENQTPIALLTEARPTWIKKWGSLIILSLALAIIIIDTTLLNVSLSTIIRDLKTDIQHLQWVITAYSLVLASLTITGGRLGDLFGRKRMFKLGAVIFACGSLVASFSPSVGVLVIGESIIEGIGGAMMMPATASLLVANFKGRDRAIAFGIWGGIAAAASAIGPILGGYLTTNYSWRWGFRINVIVAAILVAGSILIKESRDMEEKPTIDWYGVLLSALGLLSLSFGIIEASRYGWWMAKEVFKVGGLTFEVPFGLSISIPAILLGFILLGMFMMWERKMERRRETPLVSTKLFKNSRFVSGIVTTGVMSLGQSGMFFVLPVFFQAVRGLDAFHTGLGLLPLSVTLLIMAPFSAYISKYVYPKHLIMTGLFINIIAYVVLIFSLKVTATPLTLMPGLILYGIGMGLVMAQISNITLSAVSVEEAGEASGVNNTMRQIGSTLGSAIIGSILITQIASGLTGGINTSNVIPAELKSNITTALSKQTSNVEFAGGARFSANLPEPFINEITRISHESTTKGNRMALLYAGGFSLLALLTAIRLPKERNVEREETAHA